ncbi:MAG: hypothetical protein A3H93_09180 [Rhodocyclales bacterium RIFCSPLOWO2_02_FULL_63_24]|nr:MAG: hypothetical protein A3H93_09180 [Rhodocyclales bacterium RIFCSPLOWO2_02_FULL_63_24]
MDLDTAKFMLQVLEFVVVGSCSVYVYIANKNRVTNERITEMETGLEEKIDGHGERIAHLEAHAEQAPTHGDLGDLYTEVNKVNQQVSAQGGKLDSIDATVRMILSRITEKGLK